MAKNIRYVLSQFYVRDMKRKGDTRVSWEEVEEVYEEALKDFSELEELGAECLFGTPASTAKQMFEDRFGFTVKERLGDPSAVLENMVAHAKSVLTTCAKVTSSKWALKSIIRKSGRNCFVSWNWSPIKGVCTLYKYDPLAPPFSQKRLLDKKEVPCPKGEENYTLANVTAMNALGMFSWINECLLEARNIISKGRYENGQLIVERVWDVEEEARKWYEPLEKKWSELEESIRMRIKER